MNNNILDLINDNKWDDAIRESMDIFDKILDGKNIFHYACIRGKESVILSTLDLQSLSVLLSDDNGNTGAHLLAINGWDSILLKVIVLEPTFLKLKNNIDKFVYNYVITREKPFFEIIKIMKKMEYLKYLNFVRYDKQTLLIDILDKCDDTNSNDFRKIKFLLDYDINWNIPEQNLPFITLLKNQKEDICNFILDNVKTLNINTFAYDQINLLQASIHFNMQNIAIKLIDIGADINCGGPENTFIPLSISFKTGQLEISKKLLEKPDIKYDEKDNYLNTPIYYLLDYINNNRLLLQNNEIVELVKNVIKNSDLLNVNINNVTPLHLITNFRLWYTFRDILETKQININILDRNKKNALSDLSNEETSDFMAIVDKQVKNDISSNIEKRIELNFPEIIDDDSNFGLFNADGIHNMTYIIYILEKYKNCNIPMRYPIDDKIEWDTCNLQTQSFDRDPISNLIVSVVNFYNALFYPMLPHVLFWRDKGLNFKPKKISLYLSRCINTQCRFVVLKLSLVPFSTMLHANIIIYDKQTNRIIRFEPYGDWDLLDSFQLDKMIIGLFKKSISEDKTKSLKYVRPTEYLSKTKFQSSSFGDHLKQKNLGDPDGYCLAWCYWFLELKLLNPDLSEKLLVESTLNEIIMNAKDTDTNPLLNYIRKYSKHLDKEKNIIFRKIGINESEFYKINYTDDTYNKYKNYISDYVKNKLTID